MINGANVSRLLSRSSHAKVFGVDYSPVSVEKLSKVNSAAMAVLTMRRGKDPEASCGSFEKIAGIFPQF